MTQPLNERYELLQRIGRGSFGDVWKAVDHQTQTDVAIKVINLDNSTDEVEDISREIHILSQCQSPHVIHYHTSYVHQSALHIVLEYMNIGSIHDLLLYYNTGLDECYVSTIVHEMLHAVQYLHQQNLIHRDIKAANILLNKQGQIKITDFGVSATMSHTLQRHQTFVGTPYWMAPEVIQQCEYNEQCDIWSLGISTIEMLCGKPPHSELHPMKALFAIPRQPAPTLDHLPHVSAHAKSFVQLCCNKNPAERPTIKELLKHPFVSSKKKASLLDLIDAIAMYDQQQQQQETPSNGDERTVHSKAVAVGTFDYGDGTVRAPPPALVKSPSYSANSQAFAMPVNGSVNSNYGQYGTVRRHDSTADDNHTVTASSVPRLNTAPRKALIKLGSTQFNSPAVSAINAKADTPSDAAHSIHPNRRSRGSKIDSTAMSHIGTMALRQRTMRLSQVWREARVDIMQPDSIFTQSVTPTLDELIQNVESDPAAIVERNETGSSTLENAVNALASALVALERAQIGGVEAFIRSAHARLSQPQPTPASISSKQMSPNPVMRDVTNQPVTHSAHTDAVKENQQPSIVAKPTATPTPSASSIEPPQSTSNHNRLLQKLQQLHTNDSPAANNAHGSKVDAKIATAHFKNLKDLWQQKAK